MRVLVTRDITYEEARQGGLSVFRVQRQIAEQAAVRAGARRDSLRWRLYRGRWGIELKVIGRAGE